MCRWHCNAVGRRYNVNQALKICKCSFACCSCTFVARPDWDNHQERGVNKELTFTARCCGQPHNIGENLSWVQQLLIFCGNVVSCLLMWHTQLLFNRLSSHFPLFLLCTDVHPLLICSCIRSPYSIKVSVDHILW